jgi:DNA primase
MRYEREVPELPVAPILKELTGEDVLEVEKGFGWRKISCPFPNHDDRHPSASISYAGFKCFPCDTEGDAYSLLMAHLGLSFNEALSRGMEIVGIESTTGRPKRKKRRASTLLGYSSE